MRRSDKRTRGRGSRNKRSREFVLEPEDLESSDQDEAEEQPTEGERNTDPKEWRKEFVRKYKPGREKRSKEFDYENPKPTEEEEKS